LETVDVEGTILALLRGEKRAEALGLMMSSYGERTARFIVRRVGDPDLAHDLTQETFVRAMVGLGSFRGECRALTWLTRIAFNVVYSSHTARRRRRQGQERYVELRQQSDGASHGGERPDLAARRQEVIEAIDACFGRMNDVIGDLALLVWVEGHSFVEAATIAGMNEDAVRKRLTRARPALQRCLELRGVVGAEP
jgi:RNA polymerase sigma-70 factor (ECF subfamily)